MHHRKSVLLLTAGVFIISVIGLIYVKFPQFVLGPVGMESPTISSIMSDRGIDDEETTSNGTIHTKIGHLAVPNSICGKTLQETVETRQLLQRISEQLADLPVNMESRHPDPKSVGGEAHAVEMMERAVMRIEEAEIIIKNTSNAIANIRNDILASGNKATSPSSSSTPSWHSALSRPPFPPKNDTQHASSPTEMEKPTEALKGCILYSDSRKMEPSSKDVNKGYDYWELNGAHLPLWLATKYVNRAYARRHGYSFWEAKGEDFPKDRHPSWYKLLFLREKLQCCCKWAFFLDSDAYFRMDNHLLSIENWVKSLENKGHFDYIPRQFHVSLENQTWFPYPPSQFLDNNENIAAIIPRNGAGNYGYWGYYFFDPKAECLNAGVMLWKRSKSAFKMLDDLYNVPEDYRERWYRPWEQSRLNTLVPLLKDNLLVVPYFELTGPNGSYVRHLWSSVEERQQLLLLSVLGLVVAEEQSTYFANANES